VRLFVGVWPPEPVRRALAAIERAVNDSSLRWERAANWHVTLAFLGSVPDEELDDLVAALQGLSWLSAGLAVAGPATEALGRGVLCVPVAGIDDIAAAARSATLPFNRSEDKDRPFVGHLTLARARRRSVSRRAVGLPVEASWAVEDVRLMASRTGPAGSSYDVVARVGLAGSPGQPPPAGRSEVEGH
jgi:RNA 2',3'-cyclic 3'-phosphodiesterase